MIKSSYLIVQVSSTGFVTVVGKADTFDELHYKLEQLRGLGRLFAIKVGEFI